MTVNPVQLLDTYGPQTCRQLEPDAARRWCRRLTHRRYENFTVLSPLVPVDRRDDFAAIYAFCRWADDLGDEVGDPTRSLELLAWWRQELDQCFAGAPRHPVFVALAPTIERHELTREPFDDLISAFEQDQRVQRYETWTEVLDYCRLSANPVGRLVLAVLADIRSGPALAESDATCTALQLTNHWQDIGRDLRDRDRVYIPRELITIDDFEARARASNIQGYAVDRTFLGETRALVRELVARTWPQYEAGLPLLGRLPRAPRAVVALLAAGGQRVLRMVEEWNYETVLHRPSLGPLTKGRLVARLAGVALRSRGDATMTVLIPSAPSAAVDRCRAITRDRARNFYYGLKLLPEPERSALFVVYAWMRAADDLVDDAPRPASETRAQLEALRSATVAALEGRPADDDLVLTALAETAGKFNLAPEHFHAMIDGQIADLQQHRYERFEDLRWYCEQVASSVGLVCISIWGYQDDRAPQRAIDRGVAFQLTNILRDFAEDLERGRVYLPQEDFARHGLTSETIGQADDERVAAFLREQIDRVESYYRAARDLAGMVTPSCRPTLWAMTEIYHGLLRRMRREPVRIVRGPRVRLNALTKSAIALKARWHARGER